MQPNGRKRVFLAFLLLTNLWRVPAWAQLPPSGLRIVIVEGDGAINNIKQRTNREPIVQVEDENRKPVAGAAVTFFLPNQGPSGTFLNGARSLTVTTDSQGRAAARGFKPNNQTGQLQMRVTASFQGQTASAVIAMTNAAGAGSAGGLSTAAKIWIGVAIAGAGAAGAAVAVTRGGSSPTPTGPPPIVLTPGTPMVGGPRS